MGDTDPKSGKRGDSKKVLFVEIHFCALQERSGVQIRSTQRKSMRIKSGISRMNSQSQKREGIQATVK
jgi:hypothetical protein